MSRIKILSESVSNRIAAGEVIERPASVLKELVENSLDSGATAISVAIENAGTRLVSVCDNGSGMDQDDAILSLEPHATSKITIAEDLDKIITFGFRGEALPSIASVSRMRIRTRRNGDTEGTEVVCEGGRLLDSRPVGCACGTEVLVRDLFYNTPARKKFLFSNSTEEKHISDVFFLSALANHKISFDLKIDGKELCSSPAAADLRPRLRTIFGKNMDENLIPLEFSGSEIRIHGYISKHGFTKNSRKEQKIFVNGRPVESPAVYSGIRDAYGGIVPEGRFAPVILFIEIDPARVDVNVHPAKREIRFRETRLISAAVSKAIRECLRISQAPSIFVDSQIPLRSILANAEISYLPKKDAPDIQGFDKIIPPPLSFFSQDQLQPVPNSNRNIQDPGKAEPQQDNSKGAPSPRPAFTVNVMGMLGKTYIVGESENGLLLVDQHAAHERILFEEILKGTKNLDPSSQKLLIPVTVELGVAEAVFLRKNISLFEATGFEIEFFGSNTAVVDSIPQPLSQDNIGGLLSDMINNLLEHFKTGGKINEAEIARTACSLAIKAHDQIGTGEAEKLIHRLSFCELPFSCPHGRPTIINISFTELEKRFGRRN